MEGDVVNGLSFALTVNRFTPFALLLFHDQPHSNQLTHTSFQKSSFVHGKSQRYPTNCELCMIFFLHALENIWWRLLKLLAFISANVGFLLRVFLQLSDRALATPSQTLDGDTHVQTFLFAHPENFCDSLFNMS